MPYLQAIKDVTTGPPGTGIHLEPGLWVIVPSTTDPAEGVTLARMASIPHGTTILAQGTSTTFNGPPNIPRVDITPFIAGQPDTPPNQIRFASQTAAASGTPRIPQDLTSFIAAGTITQAMLDDPNVVLRNILAHQKILTTTQISISTAPAAPLFGGGTDNIAFLQGGSPNAQSLELSATFWIEAVEHTIIVPVSQPGGTPLTLDAEPKVAGQPVPSFIVRPPIPIPVPRPITFTSTQIQYSQLVILRFNGLSWPHVSVATLVPAGGVVVPPSAWE